MSGTLQPLEGEVQGMENSGRYNRWYEANSLDSSSISVNGAEDAGIVVTVEWIVEERHQWCLKPNLSYQQFITVVYATTDLLSHC